MKSPNLTGLGRRIRMTILPANSKLVNLLKSTASIVILALAVWILGWEEVLDAFCGLSTISVVLVVLVLLLEFPVLGYRWYLIIRDRSQLGLYQHLKIYFLANIFNIVTPAQIGGDAYRYVSLSRDNVPPAAIVGRLLHERLVGLLGFLIFFLGCFVWAVATGLLTITSLNFPLTISVVSIVAALGAALLGRPLIGLVESFGWTAAHRWLATGLEAAKEMFQFGSAKIAVQVGLFSIGGGLIWTLAVAIVAWDVGVVAPIALFGMAAIFSDLVRLIPITIQGVGLREASFAYAFQVLGLDPEKGFVVGLISYLAVGVATILIGAIGYLMPDVPNNIGETE